MVKPIALYGCQVWCQNPIKFDRKDIQKIDKIPFEKLQNKECKYLLNVRKNVSNIAVRAELGRYPLYITM